MEGIYLIRTGCPISVICNKNFTRAFPSDRVRYCWLRSHVLLGHGMIYEYQEEGLLPVPDWLDPCWLTVVMVDREAAA